MIQMHAGFSAVTGTGGGAVASKKLRQAGQQFESLLLTDVFSKLRQSFSLEGGNHSDAGHDSLAAFADQALCDAMAARGSLGIGAMISRAVTNKNSQVATDPADGLSE